MAQNKKISAPDEENTFREMYKILMNKELELIKGDSKDIFAAIEEKRQGNEYYVKRQFKDALIHYGKGILTCPQNSDEAREILCKLIGNRTAVNVELQCYDKVLLDIAYLTDIGNYPAQLKYRILWRKALCYGALGDPRADETFDQAIKSLTEDSNLKAEELDEQIKFIEDHRKNKKEKVCEPSTFKFEVDDEVEKFKGSEKYPAVSPLIDFEYDDNKGRYAVAKEDIPIGTLIVKENPYVAAVDKERRLTNCQFCFAYVDQLVACSTCTNVVFCSTVCMHNAKNSFHGTECEIYATIIRRFDIMLALRIITQRGFSFFADQKDKLLSYLESDDRGLTKKDVYRSDDYDNILLLYRNIRNKQEEQIYFEDAVCVLRLLKTTAFFPFQTKQNVLLDEELFIGQLILRHCMVMDFNIHAINELTFFEYDKDKENQHVPNGEIIGVGLFPTLTLFNHSCEARIIRYYDKKQVVVRTIKPIRAGETVYDNYGPNFLFVPLEERQKKLKENYHFQCQCPPCVEKWPTFCDMELIVVKIPCKTSNCDYIFSLTRTIKPKRCVSCDRPLLHSDIKEVIEAITTRIDFGERMFQAKKYDEALESYKTVLELKYRHATQPDSEIVRVQGRMEYIYARNGNRAKHL